MVEAGEGYWLTPGEYRLHRDIEHEPKRYIVVHFPNIDHELEDEPIMQTPAAFVEWFDSR